MLTCQPSAWVSLQDRKDQDQPPCHIHQTNIGQWSTAPSSSREKDSSTAQQQGKPAFRTEAALWVPGAQVCKSQTEAMSGALGNSGCLG